MLSCLRLATLLAVGLLTALPAAHAQTRGQSPDTGRIPGWVFTPAMGMGGAWDDNVLLVNPADRPPPDYASPISPSLSLDYTGRRTQMSSGYHGSWVLYRNLQSLNSFDQNLRVSVQHRATSRLTLSAQEHLTVSPSTDAVLLAGVPFYRVGTRTNAAGGGFDAALSSRMSLSSAYTLRSVAFDRNDPVGRALQGGHSHEVTTSLERAVSTRLTVSGAYTFNRAIVGANLLPGSDTGFDGPLPIPVGPGEDRFNIQRGSVTAQYRLSPTVNLSGSLGLARLGEGLTHAAQTGPTWGMGASRRGRHAVVAANYQRSYVPSFGFGGTFQNQEFTGSVLVPFARRRAYLDSSLSWLQNDPIAAAQPSLPTISAANDPIAAAQPSLRTISAANVLGYRVTRWLNAEGYFVRTQQDTQLAGGQLARNQLGFRLVAARPMRLR